MGRDKREEMAARFAARGDPLSAAQGRGLVIDAADLLAVLDRRESARAQWRTFFEDWDVLVGPMTLDAAFLHEDRPWEDRTIDVDGAAVPYAFKIISPMWAIFPGQPSTAFPAGLSLDGGLPLGLQAVGPYLE
ncbi:MAG: amidase family protein, partial [Ilumatobacteraceae bacterium]